MDLEAEVKAIIEKERLGHIESIKEDVYGFIKERSGKVDAGDVACNFTQFPCDVLYLAVYKLIEEGRVERREAVWNVQPYRLFAR